jgi:hypothetical protein
LDVILKIWYNLKIRYSFKNTNYKKEKNNLNLIRAGKRKKKELNMWIKGTRLKVK